MGLTADPGDIGRGAHARVVVLAGPSGSGKSRLAERLKADHAWPIVRLDDFYRDLDDPAMPLSAELGIGDWDHPDSWDCHAAVDALAELLATGKAAMPVYDIATSRATGTQTVTAGPGDLVLAEGIFSAEIIGPLRQRGLLHSAWCIRRRPWVTFVLRLVRDLRERRKPPVTLLRRGLALCRAEPAVVRRQVGLGAAPARTAEVVLALSAAITSQD